MAVTYNRWPYNACTANMSNVFDATVEYVRLYIVIWSCRLFGAIIWLLPITGGHIMPVLQTCRTYSTLPSNTFDFML
jgi:hypothetical protein